jgi:hypothetical protein
MQQAVSSPVKVELVGEYNCHLWSFGSHPCLPAGGRQKPDKFYGHWLCSQKL